DVCSADLVGRLSMTTAERDASTRTRASQHRAGLSRTLRLDDSLRNTCRFGYRKSRSAIWFQLTAAGGFAALVCRGPGGWARPWRSLLGLARCDWRRLSRDH